MCFITVGKQLCAYNIICYSYSTLNKSYIMHVRHKLIGLLSKREPGSSSMIWYHKLHDQIEDNAHSTYRSRPNTILLSLFWMAGRQCINENRELPWCQLCRHLWHPVSSFSKEVNPRLAKRPLKTNGLIANLGLTSSVKEVTVGTTGGDKVGIMMTLGFQWPVLTRRLPADLPTCIWVRSTCI